MDWNEYFMRGVYWVASKSPDLKTHIGAIIVKDNRIISTGYNGLATKILHKQERLERPQKYLWTVHAEENSIVTSARFGISTKECKIFTNALPCVFCCKSICQSGIKEVILHKQFHSLHEVAKRKEWLEHDEISKIMFQEADVKVSFFDGILNIKTLFNGKIVEV